MGKKLAIQGHDTRGNEVIELLKMMGGSNDQGYIGTNTWKDEYYFLDNGCIRAYDWCDGIKFTLEEFLEKYPFKLGDKVIDIADGCPGTVSEMKWDEDVSDMKYFVAFGNGIDFGWYVNDAIEFCNENKNLEEIQSNQDIDKDVDNFRKEFCERCGSQRCSGQDDELEYCERFKNLIDNLEKTSVKNHKMGPKSKLPSKCYEDKLEEIKSKRDIDKSEFIIKHMILPNKVDDKLEYEIIDGYEFDKVENNKIILKPIKPKYPTTYVECKEMMGENAYYGFSALMTLQNLIICRDTYWKIAGEEMGLGKSWEPDLENEELYCVQNYNKQIIKSKTNTAFNKILIFPTEKNARCFL